jgi:hypothetical protein
MIVFFYATISRLEYEGKGLDYAIS